MRHIYVVGRFPPPMDGQAIATRRVADLLSREFDVERFDMEPEGNEVRRHSSLTWSTFQKNVRLRRSLHRTLAGHPTSIVVWPAVSSSTAGHFRDRVITVPAFGPGRRIIGVIHRGNFDEVFRRATTRFSAVRLVERTACFVFLTDQLARRCEPWIPSYRRAVIPNTIDEEMIPADETIAAKQSRRETIDRLRLLFVANMIPSKGYLDLLRATALLRREGRDIEAHFAGQWMTDKDRFAFEHEAQSLGVRDCVVHHGRISDRAQIRRLYEDADVFLLPTYYENEAQPLSIIEALSAGTPVVATRHAGIPEMITEDEAAFVEAHDPDGIAAAVVGLIPVPTWIQKSRNARSRFMQMYAPKHVAAQWSTLLNSIKAQPDPAQG